MEACRPGVVGSGWRGACLWRLTAWAARGEPGGSSDGSRQSLDEQEVQHGGEGGLVTTQSVGSPKLEATVARQVRQDGAVMLVVWSRRSQQGGTFAISESTKISGWLWASAGLVLKD